MPLGKPTQKEEQWRGKGSEERGSQLGPDLMSLCSHSVQRLREDRARTAKSDPWSSLSSHISKHSCPLLHKNEFICSVSWAMLHILSDRLRWSWSPAKAASLFFVPGSAGAPRLSTVHLPVVLAGWPGQDRLLQRPSQSSLWLIQTQNQRVAYLLVVEVLQGDESPMGRVAFVITFHRLLLSAWKCCQLCSLWTNLRFPRVLSPMTHHSTPHVIH